MWSASASEGIPGLIDLPEAGEGVVPDGAGAPPVYLRTAPGGARVAAGTTCGTDRRVTGRACMAANRRPWRPMGASA